MITPKSLRETLCLAQSAVNQLILQGGMQPEAVQKHVDLLGDLINAVDTIRPLASNGKHGDGPLCTDSCGCEGHDKPWCLTFPAVTA